MAINKESLKGVKWKDIYNMSSAEFSRLDKDTLKIAIQRLARQANKRIRSFDDWGMTSPATKWVERTGGKFTVRGKTFSQLRSEFARVRDFLSAETSTIKGFNELKHQVTTTLKREHDIELDEDDYEKVWKAYDIISENDPDFKTSEYKYRLIETLEQYVYDRRMTGKSIARRLLSDVNKLEKLKKVKSDVNGISGLFNEIE